MEVTPEDNTLSTPIITDTKKRPALTSTSSILPPESPFPKSPSQDTISKDTHFSKPKPIKISQPSTKKIKLKRHRKYYSLIA